LMVDYVISSNIIAFPYLYLPILSVTTFQLEGNAIKFRELGGQQFRGPTPGGVH
jgi:hypothetical protein